MSWVPNVHFMWNQCPPKSWHNNSFLGSVYIKFQSDFAQDWQSERYLSARVMMNGVPDGVNFLIFCLKGFEWPQEATSLPPCTVWWNGISGGSFVYMLVQSLKSTYVQSLFLIFKTLQTTKKHNWNKISELFFVEIVKTPIFEDTLFCKELLKAS